LSGNETIAGVKTFSSIPVLPASDPTTDNQAVRKAFVDGLSLGKIIAVKSAVFTGTQSSSVASGGNVAITDLSISHACAHEDNQILLLGQVGLVGNSQQRANTGIAFAADGALLNVGSGSGTQVAAGGFILAQSGGHAHSRHISFLYAPEDTDEVTYTLRAINAYNDTRTVYINRQEVAQSGNYYIYGSSSLILLEVSA